MLKKQRGALDLAILKLIIFVTIILIGIHYWDKMFSSEKPKEEKKSTYISSTGENTVLFKNNPYIKGDKK